MKHIALWLLVLLMVPLNGLSEGTFWYRQEGLQPVMLRGELTGEPGAEKTLIDEDGYWPNELMDALHPALTSGYRPYDVDISPVRIAMLLDDGEACLLRIACWDESSQAYALTDWNLHDGDVLLDDYHDGNCVLLEFYSNEAEEEDRMLRMTIELMDGTWQLTSFTNSNDYFAEQTDSGYRFSDYFENELPAFWQNVTCPTEISRLSMDQIWAMIDAYNAQFPLRPSLNDAFYEEEE